MDDPKLGPREFTEIAAEILDRSLSCRFEALGSSMLPFIRSGDFLTVKPVDPMEVLPGEIVLYRKPGGKALLHRVVRRRARGDKVEFEIRGDAQRGLCDEVDGDQILGRVDQAQRGSRVFLPGQGWMRAAALLWVLGAPLTVPMLQVLIWLQGTTYRLWAKIRT